MFVLYNQENLSGCVKQRCLEKKPNQVAMSQIGEGIIINDPNSAKPVPQPIWSSINEIQASLLKIF